MEKEFAASHGITQGCPLSVLLLNLFVNTWARSVKAGTTTAMPKVHADDAGVLSTNSEDIDIASQNHWTFCHCHSAKTERGKKTKVWGTTESALQSVRNLDLNGEHLYVVSKLKSLGSQLRCARRMTNDVAKERVRKGITCLQANSLGTSAASNESQLDCVFGWTGGHVWFPCGWLHSQAGKFAANSGGRSTVGHEAQKPMS